MATPPEERMKDEGGRMKKNKAFFILHPSAFILELERETGFEPATSTLARSHSTTELLPHFQSTFDSNDSINDVKAVSSEQWAVSSGQ